jgi:YD repeat-containing protein
MKPRALAPSSLIARLACFALACALAAPPQFIAFGQRLTPRAVTPAVRRAMRQTLSPPASNLPNLDEIRALQPGDPHAPTPEASTACSPLNPTCQGGSGILRSPFIDPRGLSSDSYQLARALNIPTLESLYASTHMVAVTDAPDAMLSPARRANSAAGTNAVFASMMMQATDPRSLSLNGTSDYLEVPNSSSINVTTAFTAEAWIKLNSSTGAYQSIFERYGQPDVNGNNGGFYFRVKPDGKLEFIVNKSIQSGYGAAGNTSLTSGVWHHVAAVDDGTRLAIFVDGVLDGSFTVTNYPATGTTNLFVGSGNWGGGRINGKLDEARLTASALYTSNFTPQASLSPDANTRGLWKFDGQTADDFSGNGNTPIVRGAPSYSTDVPSPGPRSASFDGSTGRVSVPISTSLNITGAITVEGWFKVTDNNSIMAIAGTQNGQGGYILAANQGMPQFYLTQNSSLSDFAIAWPPVITPNEWHHMAGVADGSQIRVYLDGALVASKSSTVLPGATTTAFAIGSNFNGGWAALHGNVDEVRVTAAALYTSNFTPAVHPAAGADTRGLWRFDGGRLLDVSGNGNDGSFVGGASYSTDVPTQNQPPSVTVTAPSNNSTFANDSTVNVTADAYDADGTVSKVEFLRGGAVVFEDTTAPYSYTWNNATAGSYTLTARATDNAGATTTSSGINVTVSQPSVTVAATDANASEQGSDPGVFTVSRAGGTSQPLTVGYAVSGTATNGADYATLSGTVTIPVGASSQTVIVTPVDDTAVEGSETVTLTLSANAAYAVGAPSSATVTVADNDTNPPTVSLTSPTSGAVVTAPATVTINASAADSDGTVSKVEFYQGQTKIGEDTTAPYSYTWSNVAAGVYSLTAVATDNAGATGSSSAVTVTVNSAPTVGVTAPTGGSVFTAPASVNITAAASDADGTVSKVEFFQNGTKIGEDATAPYSVPWSAASPGGYSLTAVATDNQGATTTSSPISVTVNGVPSVSLTAPAAGNAGTAPASITISANASDADGTVAKVEFFQGATKLGEVTAAPYNFTWPNVGAGSYSLTARATDNQGATTTSAAVAVTVNGPPTISLTAPSTNSVFVAGSTVTISATASDTDGSISKVEFYRDGTLLGTTLTAPYSYTWTNVPAGSYSLTAVATDNTNATTTSAAVAVSAVDFLGARLDAANRTGSDDLFSRNFNWGANLVHLPGRAGLDLDLSLSYNSLVWLKSGSAMLFDPDRSFPTPGFRLGFPVVQGKTHNAAANADAYVLVTPSGARVELRQKGTTNTYESVDSSYMQLVEGGGALALYPGDGSVLSFANLGGDYQCTRVTDRNGNYLSISYNSFNRPATVTDTLGRVITFNYDSYQNPISITQVRTVAGQQQTHVWASFGYASRTIDASFAGISGSTVFGTVAGQVPVLAWVGLDDGTRYSFVYNAKGQVTRVTRAAQNSSAQWVDLSYVSYAMTDDGADCPRYTSSAVWAKDWNNGNEVSTTYSVEGAKQVATQPDGTQQKIIYETVGWQRGLVLGTETWSASELKRSTTTAWTQDDPTVSYPLNPRVTSSSVSDSANSRRTEIEYVVPENTTFHLPMKVSEFKGSEITPLRYTQTIYETGYDYPNLRHIVGLVKEQKLYDGANALLSRTGYAYDDGCVSDVTGVAGHDDSYSAAVKRGALCTVTRYDAQNPTASITAARMTYNSLGSLLMSKDADNHQTTTSYTDAFADGISRNTYAYPTSATDGDGFTSTVRYDYGLGLPVRAQGPPPQGHAEGAIRATEYDAAGRPFRVKTFLTSAAEESNQPYSYARQVYSPGQDFVASFSLVDVVNGANVEEYSVQVFDGLGRVRASASNHPNSTGGYAGQIVEYNNLGHTVKQYNPVEINASWLAAGDDAQSAQDGWTQYSSQTYDWKGRPLVSANADGTTKSASYDGCGCAGGEVVTLTDEMQRKQKVYHDVLGRVVKTEVLNPNETIYSATTNEYNARDQVTRTRSYQGPAPNPEDGTGTYQEATAEYDGYGRLWKGKAPDQSAQTVYAYNNDGTTQSMTDARGVTANYGYNARHLVTGISYDRHGMTSVTTVRNGVTVSSDLPAAPAVTYQYDAAGNRTSMATENGAGGSCTYGYDVLSRMTSETRYIAGLPNSYTISYVYSAAGALTKVTDPAGASVGYTYDAAGRLRSVSGEGYSYSEFANNVWSEHAVSSFASDMKYRAWGGLKDVDHGSGAHNHLSYNARLLPTSYALNNVGLSSPQGASMSWSYDYYADGRLQHAYDAADNHFDRAYAYDHVGRLAEAYTGREARGETIPAGTTPDSPYRMTYNYDAFGHQQSQTGRIWQMSLSGRTDTYTNDRVAGWAYDAAGHVVADTRGTSAYDATGERVVATSGIVGGGPFIPQYPAFEDAYTFDGDGQMTKLLSTARTEHYDSTTQPDEPTSVTETQESTYYVRSSVMGGYVLEELDAQGRRTKAYVYAGGQRLAEQRVEYGTSQTFNYVKWQHQNPVTGSWVEVAPGGTASRVELDARGGNVGTSAPVILSGGGDPFPPLKRDGEYFQIEGGQTGEMEIGMEGFEQFYLNKVYGKGAGPGQNYIELEERLRQQKLMGAQFLFGMDRIAAVVGGSYEWVDQWEDLPGYDDANGVLQVTSRNVGYFRQGQGAGNSPNFKPTILRDPTNRASFTSGVEPRINDLVKLMLSQKCLDAFDAAGLVNPAKLLASGVVIGPASLLADGGNANLKYMGITSNARDEYKDTYSSGSDLAMTIRDRPGITRTTDGKPRIFLNASAFQEGIFGLGLQHVLIHEFIHAGGAPPKYSPYPVGGDDLSYLGWNIKMRSAAKGEMYPERTKVGVTEDDIQEACR